MPAPPHLGLRHVALRFFDLAAAERFFVDVLGYEVEWRPDPENVYLRGAGDNVALHRTSRPASPAPAEGLLDHIGILLAAPAQVDAWAEWLASAGARILSPPRTHRDGARSLSVEGPEGLVVQVIHHPPLAPPG